MQPTPQKRKSPLEIITGCLNTLDKLLKNRVDEPYNELRLFIIHLISLAEFLDQICLNTLIRLQNKLLKEGQIDKATKNKLILTKAVFENLVDSLPASTERQRDYISRLSQTSPTGFTPSPQEQQRLLALQIECGEAKKNERLSRADTLPIITSGPSAQTVPDAEFSKKTAPNSRPPRCMSPFHNLPIRSGSTPQTKSLKNKPKF